MEINSIVYTFSFYLKTRLSSYPALSRMPMARKTRSVFDNNGYGNRRLPLGRQSL